MPYQSDPFKLRKYTCKNKQCGIRYEKRMVDKNIEWCSDECKKIVRDEKAEKLTRKAMRNLAKIKKEKREAAKAKNKEKHDKWRKELGISKTKTDPLQSAINELVRELDKGKPCYVFPAYNTNGVPNQAGHCYGRGARSNLRYLLLNIHGESVYSNHNQDIDDIFKLEGLAARLGEWVKEALRVIHIENKVIKVSSHEKNEKIKIVRKLINRVKKGEILTRRYCDEQIGIYQLNEFYENV